MEDLKSLEVRVDEETGVGYVYMNRPKQRNAMDGNFFMELPRVMAAMDANPSVRAIVVGATGNHFCSGIDLRVLALITNTEGDESDQGRVRERLRRSIKDMQDAITSIEKCRKPVIAAIHGACVGGGIDLVTACDMRYSTHDAFFSVKEVDLAITADLGTLQRLPALVGRGRANELALTGRIFKATEAYAMGLVQGVFGSKSELDEQVRGIACDIASKSPLSVTGTKAVMLRTRDMNLDQGLDYVATWNSAMLLSSDLKEALTAFLQKRKPRFAKL